MVWRKRGWFKKLLLKMFFNRCFALAFAPQKDVHVCKRLKAVQR